MEKEIVDSGVEDVSFDAETTRSYLVRGSSPVTSTTILPPGYVDTSVAAPHAPPNVLEHRATADVAFRHSAATVAEVAVDVTPVGMMIPGRPMHVPPKTFLANSRDRIYMYSVRARI